MGAAGHVHGVESQRKPKVDGAKETTLWMEVLSLWCEIQEFSVSQEDQGEQHLRSGGPGR